MYLLATMIAMTVVTAAVEPSTTDPTPPNWLVELRRGENRARREITVAVPRRDPREGQPFITSRPSKFPQGGDPRSPGLSPVLVTDDMLADMVGHFNQLRVLRLQRSEVTDAGLAHLSKIGSLTDLSIGSDAITDAGISHLAALKQLTVLRLYGTAMTREGIEALKRQLPNTNVIVVSVPLDMIQAYADRIRSLSPDTSVEEVEKALGLPRYPFGVRMGRGRYEVRGLVDPKRDYAAIYARICPVCRAYRDTKDHWGEEHIHCEYRYRPRHDMSLIMLYWGTSFRDPKRDTLLGVLMSGGIWGNLGMVRPHTPARE